MVCLIFLHFLWRALSSLLFWSCLGLFCFTTTFSYIFLNHIIQLHLFFEFRMVESRVQIFPMLCSFHLTFYLGVLSTLLLVWMLICLNWPIIIFWYLMYFKKFLHIPTSWKYFPLFSSRSLICCLSYLDPHSILSSFV